MELKNQTHLIFHKEAGNMHWKKDRIFQMLQVKLGNDILMNGLLRYFILWTF